MKQVPQKELTRLPAKPFAAVQPRSATALMQASTSFAFCRPPLAKQCQSNPACVCQTSCCKSVLPLLQAVAQQPVTFAMTVSNNFMLYRDPQTYNKDCSGDANWHAMLLVGYSVGSGPGKPDAYWIVKNSWGTE